MGIRKYYVILMHDTRLEFRIVWWTVDCENEAHAIHLWVNTLFRVALWYDINNSYCFGLVLDNRSVLKVLNRNRKQKWSWWRRWSLGQAAEIKKTEALYCHPHSYFTSVTYLLSLVNRSQKSHIVYNFLRRRKRNFDGSEGTVLCICSIHHHLCALTYESAIFWLPHILEYLYFCTEPLLLLPLYPLKRFQKSRNFLTSERKLIFFEKPHYPRWWHPIRKYSCRSSSKFPICHHHKACQRVSMKCCHKKW